MKQLIELIRALLRKPVYMATTVNIPTEHNVKEEPVSTPMNYQLLFKTAMPSMDTKWTNPLIIAVEEFGITDERLCMFLAQIGHESNDLRTLTENLNYSVSALTALFGNRITVEQAEMFGRKPGQVADQVSIANIIYGGKWGERNLGNTEDGDGWKFRGRGAKQITGRYNYMKCGEALALPLLQAPYLLVEPIHAVRSAAWFFTTYTDGIDIVKVTKQINGGSNGLDDRRERYERTLRVYKEQSNG